MSKELITILFIIFFSGGCC